MSSKKNRARATDSAEAQTEETTVADVDQTVPTTTEVTAPCDAPERRACSFCTSLALVTGELLEGLSLAACEDAGHRARLHVLSAYDATRAAPPSFTELATAAYAAQESDAETLAALCAAQSQHPSDIAERAIRRLVERLSSRVLVSP